MMSLDEGRNRKLLSLSAGIFVVTGSILGWQYWQANKSSASLPKGPVVRRVQDPRNPAVTWINPAPPEQLAASLAQLKNLRDKLRPWASKNKKELQAMLKADGKDTEAMLKAYQLAPYLVTDSEKLHLSSKDTKDLVWQTGIEKEDANPNDPRDAHVLNKIKGEIKQRLTLNFVRWHDVLYMTTNDHGPKHYGFWLSGRITEIDELNQGEAQSRGDESQGDVHKEIVPPYEFLQSP